MLLNSAKELKEHIESLENVIKQQNKDDIKKISHKIKGNALTLTFNKLAYFANIIEENATQDILKTTEIFNKILVEWKIIEKIVNEEFNKKD